jgi:hypothetical protein
VVGDLVRAAQQRRVGAGERPAMSGDERHDRVRGFVLLVQPRSEQAFPVRAWSAGTPTAEGGKSAGKATRRCECHLASHSPVPRRLRSAIDISR